MWCARRADDSPSYLACGIAVPRQNGKNGVLEAWEFYKLLVCGERILHTAHRVDTALKSFRRLETLLVTGADPEVRAMVVDCKRSTGREGIYLANGGLIEYGARTRSASRGNTYSAIVYDEAQELTDEQVEALMPIVSASPTGYRQTVYLGTPPGPGSPGTVFPRFRRSMLEGGAARSCWHEWGVEECPDPSSSFSDVLDDVYATNPAMGVRLDEEFTAQEFAQMAPDGFARERLGWWSPAERSDAPKLDPARWDALAVDPGDAPAPAKTAYGVKFSADGSQVAVCACDLCDGGAAVVGLVGTATLADGTAWIADWMTSGGRPDEVAAVAVDGLRGKAALMDRLRGDYPRQALMDPGTRGVVAAATMTAEAVAEGTLLHLSGDGQAPLDESARTSVERPIGRDGGWGFGGDSAACIEAASLAYWAARTTRRDPGGGCLIG